MNILIINHYAGSEKHGMEYRPFYLGREFKKLGHNIAIVAASYSHSRQEQPKFIGISKPEVIDEVNYFWLKTLKYKGNGIRRVINMLNFVFLLFLYSFKLSRKYKPDIVIASSTYPLDIFPAKLIARFAKAKCVFEVHDLWPLSPMELGGMSKHHPFIKVIQYAEDYACKRSDIVISLLPFANLHLEKRGMSPKKFFCVPNGTIVEKNSTNFTDLPEEHVKLINELRSNNHLIIGYTGAYGIANSLEHYIEAAKYFIDKKVSFVLIGKGPEKEKLIELKEELELKNIYFLSSLPKKHLEVILKKIDILFIGFKKNDLYKFGISPNKLIDYMLSAKPIINAVDAGNDPVKDANCGFSIEAENVDAIVSAITDLMKLSSYERDQIGQRGKQHVMEKYDYKILAKRFLDYLECG